MSGNFSWLVILEVAFFAFFSVSLKYSISDHFRKGVKSPGDSLNIVQVILTIFCLSVVLSTIFLDRSLEVATHGTIFAFVVILVSHAIRIWSDSLGNPIGDSGSGLYDTILAGFANLTMFSVLFSGVVASISQDLRLLGWLFLTQACIVSILMIFKECYYLLEYVLRSKKSAINVNQILFGEFLKSCSVIYIFSFSFVYSVNALAPNAARPVFESPTKNMAMGTFDFASLAFCSLLGSDCPYKYGQHWFVWVSIFLGVVGYYVLGVALAAALSRTHQNS